MSELMIDYHLITDPALRKNLKKRKKAEEAAAARLQVHDEADEEVVEEEQEEQEGKGQAGHELTAPTRRRNSDEPRKEKRERLFSQNSSEAPQSSLTAAPTAEAVRVHSSAECEPFVADEEEQEDEQHYHHHHHQHHHQHHHHQQQQHQQHHHHHHHQRLSISLESLPNEVFYLILGQLAPKELGRAALVCRHWHSAVTDDFLWQAVHATLLGPWHGFSQIRQRCMRAARALQRHFGLEIGQETADMANPEVATVCPSSSFSFGLCAGFCCHCLSGLAEKDTRSTLEYLRRFLSRRRSRSSIQDCFGRWIKATVAW